MTTTFALLIGKHHSVSLPGKNYLPVLGRPLCAYPMMAALHCPAIDRLFVSTDSPVIADIGRGLGADIIDRPVDLSQASSPTELAFSHGYREICSLAGRPDYLALMFANSADVLPDLLAQGIDRLERDAALDSVVSLSRFNMFTPLRARRLSDGGQSCPILDLDALGIPNTFDRDAMGDVYFVDFGVQIVRPDRCLEEPTAGALPFRWLGQRQGALVKDYGFDVDYAWQIPVIEHWLRDHGFTETTTPYDGVKPR